MKQYILLCAVFFSIGLLAQTDISGKSKGYTFKYTAKYERGLPPNLFVDMSFNDNNGNGILESNEEATLNLKITNKGSGKAQGLSVKIKDSTVDSNFTIGKSSEIFFIKPQETRSIEVPIKAGFNIVTDEHKLEINVTEHFGYDMDPAYLVLNTLEYQKPNIVFSGYEILDYGEGTGTIVEVGRYVCALCAYRIVRSALRHKMIRLL